MHRIGLAKLGASCFAALEPVLRAHLQRSCPEGGSKLRSKRHIEWNPFKPCCKHSPATGKWPNIFVLQPVICTKCFFY